MDQRRKRELVLRQLVLAVLQRHHGHGASTKTVCNWAAKLSVYTLGSVLPWAAAVCALEALDDAGFIRREQSSVMFEGEQCIRSVWYLTFEGWVRSVGLEPEDVVKEAELDERLERARDVAGERSM